MATVLVTGTNRGIGLQITRLLAERGDRVIAVCRKASDDLRALAAGDSGDGIGIGIDIDIQEGIDVASDEAVADLVGRLAGVQLDVVINNAGVLSSETLDDFDFDRMRRQFEINTLGPLRVAHALLGNLGAGGKIAMVTSRVGSIGDNTSGSRYGYRMSKAALNMGSVTLARDLAGRGIAVAILHPGYVRTEMTRGNGHIEADESAGNLIARIDELSMDNTGTFWHADGAVLPW